MSAFEWASGVWPDWCPGCGDFGIWTALRMALAELGEDHKRFVMVSGIGCSGKIPHFVKTTGVHTLHGRAIPFATGIRLSNPELKVAVFGGDGDILGIGMGHFVALGRRNADVLVVIHNNWVYGLTKGQAAPTLGKGVKVKSLAFPNINDPVNPILVGMTAGYTFLARSYAYNAEHLKNIFKAGIRHNGAGVLEILQPCVTWNNIMNMEWVNKNTEVLKDWDSGAKSEEELLKKKQDILRLEAGEKIPLGVLLEYGLKDTMEERLASMSPYYKEKPPAKQEIEVGGSSLPIDIEKTFERYLI